jgi:hypothetical protein
VPTEFGSEEDALLHRGLDFKTVRVVCKGCGWYRNIAHSGCADGKRALVRVAASDDPSHVLHAQVVEVPKDLPLADALRDHPGFRDLVHEAHEKGLLRREAEFLPLLSGQACPRCNTVGRLELNQTGGSGRHVRY